MQRLWDHALKPAIENIHESVNKNVINLLNLNRNLDPQSRFSKPIAFYFQRTATKMFIPS